MKKLVAFTLAVLFAVMPLMSSFAASKTKFTVTVNAVLKSNKSVGNDWTITHMFNDKEYFKKQNTIKKEGKDTISLAQGETLQIYTLVVENDKSPDEGFEEKSIKLSANDIKKGFEVKFSITVIENKGKYKGNKAVWEITYQFKPQ